MLCQINNEVSQNRASSFGNLLKVVRFQFRHNAEEVKQIILLEKQIGIKSTKEQQELLCPEYFCRQIVSIAFTGMVIELFFYDYAVVRKSKSYAESLSKKSIEIEFSEIEKEVLRSETSNTSLRDQLKSFRLVRNHFTHNKSTVLGEYSKRSPGHITPLECMELLCEIFEYFSSKDPDYPLSALVLDTLREDIAAQVSNQDIR